MKQKRTPWEHFDEAFASMDRGFRSVNRKDFEDVRHVAKENIADPQGRKIHLLTAATWRSRFRMAWLFLWLAWRILARGRASVRL